MTNGVQYNKFNANLAKEFDANLKLGVPPSVIARSGFDEVETWRRGNPLTMECDRQCRTSEPQCSAPIPVYLSSECAFHCEGLVYLPVGRLRPNAQHQRFSSQ
jgi:hypothetical protein